MKVRSEKGAGSGLRTQRTSIRNTITWARRLMVNVAGASYTVRRALIAAHYQSLFGMQSIYSFMYWIRSSPVGITYLKARNASRFNAKLAIIITFSARQVHELVNRSVPPFDLSLP